MIALVTGHRGFVGRWLVELLAAKGVQVHGFSVADDLRGTHDVRDREQVRRAVEEAQPDLVFHLAAQAFVSEAAADPHRADEVNVGGTINVLEAVRRVAPLGCRVLIAGTSEEYGYGGPERIDERAPIQPVTMYGASKAAASHFALAYAHQYGMPIVVTRAFNHTGPGQSPTYAVSSFARKLVLIEAGQLHVLEHGPLDSYRDFTDVRDVVRAYWAAVHADSGVYNVCSGQTRSMREILNELIAGAGREFVLKQTDLGHRAQASTRFRAVSRLPQRTGWLPEISLRSTLTDLLNYWREREQGDHRLSELRVHRD
jgi:GDP-4-dehydro-6-deoxy-D-mannose reductase